MTKQPASPVSLSYIAALRGVSPRKPGEAFVYADVACTDTDLLTCLAASNPEGRFFALVADDAARTRAEQHANEREVNNVAFLAGSPRTLLGQFEQNSSPMPSLNYLVCDESKTALTALERNALFTFAEKALKAGGLFHYTYRAYNSEDGALRFVVREFAPEMDVAESLVCLDELKKLGGTYLAKHPETLEKLDRCIKDKNPDEFFSMYDDGEAGSASFNTLVALTPRGFVYTGDSDVTNNYLELVVPPEAQDVIVKCQGNPLYESIKDYALDRQIRSDIWCRQPVPQSASMAELFGCFTYGITCTRDEVPECVKVQGKTVDLTSPLYTKLVDLMTLTPVGIGDFLSHPSGEGFAPLDVVGAIQILVALGIAQPMRGVHEANDVTNVSQPRLVGSFNQYLDKMPVTGGRMWMASPVAGNAVSISARDALVIQALGRAGLANSVSALLPELKRLAQNPAQAAAIMDVTDPTAEMARSMIEDVVSKSIVQWYAYGLLEAA